MGTKLLAELKRAEVISVTSYEYLSGFESTGVDRRGKEKFRYMEWWCPFVLDKEEQ